MEEAGYLRRVPGSGTYVCEREENHDGEPRRDAPEYVMRVPAEEGENRTITPGDDERKSYVFWISCREYRRF